MAAKIFSDVRSQEALEDEGGERQVVRVVIQDLDRRFFPNTDTTGKPADANNAECRDNGCE